MAIVLVVLGWKNRYQYQDLVIRDDGSHDGVHFVGERHGMFGWPLQCVSRVDTPWTIYPTGTTPIEVPNTARYTVTSWPSLLLDAAIAVAWLGGVWILFSRTQRPCQGWSQFSLATLLAFVALAAVVCAVLA